MSFCWFLRSLQAHRASKIVLGCSMNRCLTLYFGVVITFVGVLARNFMQFSQDSEGMVEIGIQVDSMVSGKDIL